MKAKSNSVVSTKIPCAIRSDLMWVRVENASNGASCGRMRDLVPAVNLPITHKNETTFDGDSKLDWQEWLEYLGRG